MLFIEIVKEMMMCGIFAVTVWKPSWWKLEVGYIRVRGGLAGWFILSVVKTFVRELL